MDGNHTQALAEFAAELCYEDLPAPVVETVKHIILDSLGCALAATTLGDGCAESIAVMERLGGPADSTILGTAKKVAAPNAAFANGALVHALNYDPIGTNIGHVGVVSLAAPLAAAEAVGGQTGRDLIVACAVAAEVTARVISAVSRTGRRPSETFLSGQLLTYFGAAAGAGRAFGLDAKDMENAFGLAMMQMAGSRQITMGGDPPAKAIYGAFPNQAGVQAALLARAGLTADVDVFGDFRGWSRMNTHPDPVDYPRVCELVEQVVTQERFGLVEALADRIAEVLQTALNLPQLVVRVRKPNPPVPTQFDGVEVEVRRGV